MTANTNPNIRILGRCARVTGMLVVSSSSLCFAQQPVVTLGVPFAITSQQLSSPEQTVPSETPPIRINAYASQQSVTQAQDSKVAKSDEGILGTPGMYLSAFTRSSQSLSDNADIKPKPDLIPQPAIRIPTQPSSTPTEPQLSPTKWVHQPMVAQEVVQQDDVEPLVQRNDLPAKLSRTNDPVRPLTEIRRAAMRQRAARPVETYDIPTQAGPIQPGYSIEALRKTAIELIAEAQLKLDIRAYLSAEEKAKQALELIAQAIDTREHSALATRDLTISLTAIREAEDFVGKYGLVDGDTISRMVRSHSTEVLKPYDSSNLNGLAAADVYLDWSRRCLTPLVIADPLAADAIRILAQSHRLRDDGTPFGIATSVHLIRAAAEGAPSNQQVQLDYDTTLKIAGIHGHTNLSNASHTRSMTLGTELEGLQKRDVNIIEVSQELFAAISPATAGPAINTHYRPDHVDQATGNQANPNQSSSAQHTDDSVKGRLGKVFNPITRLLR